MVTEGAEVTALFSGERHERILWREGGDGYWAGTGTGTTTTSGELGEGGPAGAAPWVRSARATSISFTVISGSQRLLPCW